MSSEAKPSRKALASCRATLIEEGRRLELETVKIQRALEEGESPREQWRLRRELTYRQMAIRRLTDDLSQIESALASSEPGLVLRIREENRSSRTALRIDLLHEGEKIASGSRAFSPGHRPDQYFRNLLRDIENLGREGQGEGEVARRIEDKGTFLYRKLLPAGLARSFAALGQEANELHIDSDEPYIPWEILRFPGGPFLAEAFALTRSLARKPVPLILNLRRMAAVVPRDSKLPHAEEEFLDLWHLAAQRGFELERVPARFLPLRNELIGGHFDAWHFCGHGLSHGNPDHSLLLLEGQDEITPEAIGGEGGHHLAPRRPLVFLNGCYTGQSGLSLVGIGGWASSFLEAGAGAFLGTYWSISDFRGRAFAEIFYRSLVAGVRLGEAVRRARLTIRSQEDPSWLAYTLFSAPSTRCPTPE